VSEEQQWESRKPRELLEPRDLRWTKLGAGIHAWLTIILTVLSVWAGSVTAVWFVARSVGANETILALPARVEVMQANFDKKIDAVQDKFSDALKTQVKINEDLLQTLNEIRARMDVNDNTDKFQGTDITELKKSIEELRRILK